MLHLVSLPNDYGIGDMGSGAYRFIDFLSEAGQRVWQLLPLGPTTRGESPYSCYSAFAGNPLLISPEHLRNAGWVGADDIALGLWGAERSGSRTSSHIPARGNETGIALDGLSEVSSTQVDYVAVRAFKGQLLRTAYVNFKRQSLAEQVEAFAVFCNQHRSWLDDFALFSALMKHFGTDNWCQWEMGLVKRDPGAMSQWRDRLVHEVEFEQFVQFVFFSQWQQLRDYAHQREVKLFGDMPIFVAHGSADVWAHQDLFWLDATGHPTVVAGVPPDYFSKTGQLWGNPLYNWERLADTNYHWWTRRFEAAFELYDLLRIDHFRGFEAYWSVPAGAKTAISGRWIPGPGAAPFEAAERALGKLPIVAEDLGMITEEVHALRDQLGFPGMRVLQFGFDDLEDNFHRPESYPENSAAYTGTHDNDTIMGWYQARQLSPEADLLDDYLQDPVACGMPIQWQLISMVLHSPSHTAIYPLQDVLGLDNSARMNMPGQAEGNWRWRVASDALTDDIADRLRVLSLASDRVPA